VGTWRDRTVVAIVLLLFLVPAVLLVAGPKPSRFSFQMYSGYGQVDITWTDETGAVHQVRSSQLAASLRVEIDWTRLPADLLCERLDSAVQIDIERITTDGVEHRSLPC
jgi:hypothetical protein